MTFQEYINDIKDSLADEIATALDLLKTDISKESRYFNMTILINQDYRAILDAEMKGLITFESNRVERNKIVARLLSLLDHLKEADFGKFSTNKYAKIENPILVLVNNENQKVEQESFFKVFNFSNVTVRLIEKLDWIKDFENKVDIVIVDNRQLKAENDKSLNETDKEQIRKTSQFMTQLIQFSEKYYIIHFGNLLFWLNNHRNRCNAANSKFTLYNNTKQLIEFINQYRGI